MSQNEFERADEEVMGMVNGAATPQAKQTADAIEKELTQPAVPKSRCENDGCAKECEAHALVEKLHRKWRQNKIVACSLCALTGIVLATAMVIALKIPECVVHIANITIMAAGIVVALQIEKIIKLLRK